MSPAHHPYRFPILPRISVLRTCSCAGGPPRLTIRPPSIAAQINDFLARLLLLLAQDKISTRRAAVLAYITNQLLRTLPAIAKEVNAEPTQIIFDMPGPDRDRNVPEQNPPQHAEVTNPATKHAANQEAVP